jgi:threonine aldolase
VQNRLIDLASDTKSRPTEVMRAAMAAAEVGDEQAREDPTVNRLCTMVAELLGKDDAVFLPSGKMCNQVAYRVHCRPGDEIILDEWAHGVNAEAGGIAALSGANVRVLKGDRGVFDADQVRAAIRPRRPDVPRSRLVSIEQTTNRAGGAIWPLATIEAVTGVARESGLAAHMDGARLLNAQVATGVAVRDYAAPFDSVWIDLSKGLGCPVGAVLAGSTGFIEDAWRFKHQFGGAMRQAGILAAAGVYALENHVARLADDHDNAQGLARGLAAIPGINIDPEAFRTNIIFFDVSRTGLRAEELNARLVERGVRFQVLDATQMRAVTHIDVGADDIPTALAAVSAVVGAAAPAGERENRTR